jgi:DNA sulfur modification protein DndD
VILESITLHNYGTFRSEQRIDLVTRPGKPIVLFGGKNGAGKTTLLEALQVCLYGIGAAGDRLSREAYAAFLESRIHSSPALLIQPSMASVRVEFVHAQVGQQARYTVTRTWERSTAGRIAERLEIDRDGSALGELHQEQWQDFLRELIPPGVVRLFFFDGERIQHLAEERADQQELCLSLKALLGTDLIERLGADLTVYRSRLLKPAKATPTNGASEELLKQITEREERVQELKARRSAMEAELRRLQDSITSVEQRLKAEGGSYAKHRETLISQRERATAMIQTLEQSIRHLCQGALPFALSPRLCMSLRDRLVEEQEVERQAAARQELLRARESLNEQIATLDWCPPSLSPKVRGALAATLQNLVTKALGNGHEPTVVVRHSVSPSEASQLGQWMEQARLAAEGMHELATDLEQEYRSLHKTEEAIKRLPAQDVLQPLLAELQTLNRSHGEQCAILQGLSVDLATEETALSGLQRDLDSIHDQMAAEVTTTQRLRLIGETQGVLEEFRERLLERKIEELARAFTSCFNNLSRKADAVRRASISKDDLRVTLYDREDRPIPKDRLSAGEKQIYAIAMLWALARVSGRPLPVIIDTPLGRLDSDHRRLLVERYFPSASHQVILLSTDTEVDQTYFSSLRQHVATAYRLEFDMTERCTTVVPGYFFSGAAE